MKTIMLCGGRGIRLGYGSDYIPKGMVKLGHRPLIWHIMKRYSLAGFNDFILALGLKSELIRDYFTKYNFYTNDIQVGLDTGVIKDLTHNQESEWKVSLIDTGDFAMSGARINRCKQYVADEDFMVSYSDCLSDIDIERLIAFHKKSKKIATITGIIPPYREGEFLVGKGVATGLYDASKAKSEKQMRLFNGGFMVFSKEIFKYLNSFNECRLENEIFAELIKDKQLAIYQHDGFWRWLDTDRDYLFLTDLVDRNKTYWLQHND